MAAYLIGRKLQGATDSLPTDGSLGKYWPAFFALCSQLSACGRCKLLGKLRAAAARAGCYSRPLAGTRGRQWRRKGMK